MRQLLFSVLSVVALATSLAAQQTGDAQRDYLINGGGAGGTSPVATPVTVPGVFNQTYHTLDPAAPVIWAMASSMTPGRFATATNSLDLDIASLSLIAVGGGAVNPLLSSIFFTDASGTFSLNSTLPGSLSGAGIALQMAHLAATSPDGIWLSQAHRAGFISPCGLSATLVAGLADDNFVALPLGFAWNHYGAEYATAFIGSNGFISFGVGDSDFTETLSEFLSGPPRIAMLWHDLAPNSGGEVRFFTDNTSRFRVCFSNVPESGTGGANSFDLVGDMAAGTVTMSFGAMSATDGLVGFSPGVNLQYGVQSLDLSEGTLVPQTIAMGDAVYEMFSGAGHANDLPGYTISWTMCPMGYPIAQY